MRHVRFYLYHTYTFSSSQTLSADSRQRIHYCSLALAPVIISTSSPVMTACLVRLYRILNLLIISPAFLLALSIAFRRADCSQAWPSANPQNRVLARAYSRRLGNRASSISKAVKFARVELASICSRSLARNESHTAGLYCFF